MIFETITSTIRALRYRDCFRMLERFCLFVGYREAAIRSWVRC
jgi:hypothetical protein